MGQTISVLTFFAILVGLGTAEIEFGHNLRKDFLLEAGYTNLNHGSFGSAPRAVLAEQSRIRDLTEQNPDKFYRYLVYDMLDEARKAAAAEVNADPEDIVIIENASEGMNAILRSLIAPNTGVMYLDIAYFMAAETMRYLRDTQGVTMFPINTDDLFPVTDPSAFEAALVARAGQVFDEAALSSGTTISLCSFDHISSMPSLTLPVAALTEVCKSRGALVAIDGAHVLGNIPVDVPSIGADVYVSNGHKWFYTPKGAAFLWVRKGLQGASGPYTSGSVYPTVISNEGSGESSFAKLFSWLGTKDYGAFLSLPAASKWRRALGGSQRIYDYNLNLANAGGLLLASAWNTSLLVPAGSALTSAMVTVELPTDNCTLAAQLPGLLLNQYDTWVPTVAKSGRCWMRVSAQIYNDLSDFQFLASAVTALLTDSTSATRSD